MRIVCISDTHNLTDQIVVPDGDVLVHAGDLTMRGSSSELARAAEWLASLPHAHKIIIAGNHDWGFQKSPDKARAHFNGVAHYLQDDAITIDGVKFYGSPWQPWFYDWAFNVERGAAIREKWDAIPGGTDVLITHGPPAGIMDACPDPVGCKELLSALGRVRPRLHVFGHIHEGYGTAESLTTTYVNASVCTGNYAPVNPPIVVDLVRDLQLTARVVS